MPHALVDLGARVELHRDHFPEDAPDVEWIPYASRRDWVIITQDRKIQRRPHERQAVIAARARYFCLAGGSRRGVETASLVAEHFAMIDHIARTNAPPIVARVTRAGIRLYDLDHGNWIDIRVGSSRKQ